MFDVNMKSYEGQVKGQGHILIKIIKEVTTHRVHRHLEEFVGLASPTYKKQDRTPSPAL